MIARIDLDFATRARPGRWFGIAALALAALAAAKLFDVHAESQSEIAHLEARLDQLERRTDRQFDQGGSTSAAYSNRLDEATVLEIRHANRVIDQIALPWGRLFRALEASATGRVALLGITPDQSGGTVELSGEAADLDAMFDYVKRLQRQPELSGVFLLNHQENARGALRPLQFTVTASWTEKAD
jgi:Tfp pilus assembly protein PilN